MTKREQAARKQIKQLKQAISCILDRKLYNEDEISHASAAYDHLNYLYNSMHRYLLKKGVDT